MCSVGILALPLERLSQPSRKIPFSLRNFASSRRYKGALFVYCWEEMKIEVKCSCENGNCPEWAIVELQGVVEVQPDFQNRIENLEIGQLCRTSSQEVYTFTVGYHELSGSKVTLKKPLLVLKKVKRHVGDESVGTESVQVELDVIGIIRHKILFKTRPKALISRPQPTVKERSSVLPSNASH